MTSSLSLVCMNLPRQIKLSANKALEQTPPSAKVEAKDSGSSGVKGPEKKNFRTKTKDTTHVEL